MTRPAREGRVLALIEAEFRANDPGLTAQFDEFASRGPALGTLRRWDAGHGHRKAAAARLLVVLLIPLTVLTVLVAPNGSRKAVTGRPPATAVEQWAAREGQAIRAQLCQSIPLPAGTACQ